ncbi:MAG: beta-glucosidase BglX [Elusimicrobia bacterium]|nr:beta-glucosidase BglX [Elusimicrobiota bacterium]
MDELRDAPAAKPAPAAAVIRIPRRPTTQRPAVLDRRIESKIEQLLKRMTLEEKLGQLQQLGDDGKGGHIEAAKKGRLGSTLSISGAAKLNEIQRANMEHSRLKIPVLFAHDVIHGFRTIFPIPLGEAAMWDPEAAEKASAVAAAEAGAAGLRWTFAPMVDIARDPRWGRIAEGAGEDPYLGAAMARARVRGFQGSDPSAPDKLLACAKHWIGYGAAEGGRDYNSTDMSLRTMREIYFPPFKAAVDAGVATFMSAFNDLNGVPSSGNAFTLTQVLRGEWGFTGFVVSDYESVRELIPHGFAKDAADAARLGLASGVDMEMVSRTYAENAPKLLEKGLLSQAAIDESVRRVLRQKFRAGVFERPYADEAAEKTAFLKPEYVRLARENAARSFVLLKNEKGLLPLEGPGRTIAVIGPLADDASAMLGTWAGEGKKEDAVTILQGLKSEAPAGTKIRHARGCDADCKTTDGFAAAVDAARNADVVVAVVGETGDMNGEAASRSTLDLPGRQLELVQALHATGKPVVAVLVNGRPLTIGWLAENVPAILETWHAGVQAGPAVADALFGRVTPGGKLPVTFPRTVGQVPIYYNQKTTGRPPTMDDWVKERYVSRYQDLPLGPLYEFGFGLSYTTFRLSDFALSATSIKPDGRITAKVAVENTGARDGDEVVQLYIRRPSASVTRPVRELKGFKRVSLKPGETREVAFDLGPADLGFLGPNLEFGVEPGIVEAYAGTSSSGGLKAFFEIVAR